MNVEDPHLDTLAVRVSSFGEVANGMIEALLVGVGFFSDPLLDLANLWISGILVLAEERHSGWLVISAESGGMGAR